MFVSRIIYLSFSFTLIYFSIRGVRPRYRLTDPPPLPPRNLDLRAKKKKIPVFFTNFIEFDPLITNMKKFFVKTQNFYFFSIFENFEFTKFAPIRLKIDISMENVILRLFYSTNFFVEKFIFSSFW